MFEPFDLVNNRWDLINHLYIEGYILLDWKKFSARLSYTKTFNSLKVHSKELVLKVSGLNPLNSFDNLHFICKFLYAGV